MRHHFLSKYTGLLLVSVAFFASCKKFLTVEAPINQLVNSNVFADDQSALAAVTGIYGSLANSGPYLHVCAGANADEMEYSGSTEDYMQFTASSVQVNNSYVQTIWKNMYDYIYDCNAAMEGLGSATRLTADVRTRLLGEVKFIRAFSYFWLVSYWGDVPLVLSTDYLANQSLPRTKAALVYEQIIKDLKDAKELLTDEYVGTERAYVNRAGASAMLARVYLFLGNWEEAEKEASLVIANNSYSMPGLLEVLRKESPEVIWQLEPHTLNTILGNVYIPWYATNVPQWPMTKSLVAAFENGDERRNLWVGKATVRDVDYYYPHKYKVDIWEQTNKGEYLVALRLAEMYLTRAEARAQRNNLNGENSAESDLNIVRQRASLLPVSGLDQEALLRAIAHERRIEFFAEWSIRWLDLKRTGQATTVLSGLKGNNWSDNDTLWPVPFNERQSNPALGQNIGYQ